MFDLETFHQTYATVVTPVTINGRTLNLFVPESLDGFIDPDDVMANFPLWAKVWEASAILAGHLATLTPRPGQRMLEIGCGLGLVGIVAALAGHQVTMTELNDDALHFARANALANGCDPRAVERLDWNAPHLEGRYDFIVGSEVIYRAEDAHSLQRLFERYLAPGGTIFLAAALRATSIDIWEKMRTQYHVQARRQTLRGENETQHIYLFRLQPRNSGAGGGQPTD